MSSSTSDGTLLERWRAGDRAAADELVDRYRGELAGFFRARCRGAADDLLQETLLQCARSLERFRGEASFRTFLFGVAHNVLRQHYRKKGAADTDPSVSQIIATDPSPPSLVIDRAEHNLLMSALGRLPVDLQLVVELHYSRKLTSEQIAELLETNAATVRTRLRRARELIRDSVGELSDDPGLVARTMQGFETWAQGIRRSDPSGDR